MAVRDCCSRCKPNTPLGGLETSKIRAPAHATHRGLTCASSEQAQVTHSLTEGGPGSVTSSPFYRSALRRCPCCPDFSPGQRRSSAAACQPGPDVGSQSDHVLPAEPEPHGSDPTRTLSRCSPGWWPGSSSRQRKSARSRRVGIRSEG